MFYHTINEQIVNLIRTDEFIAIAGEESARKLIETPGEYVLVDSVRRREAYSYAMHHLPYKGSQADEVEIYRNCLQAYSCNARFPALVTKTSYTSNPNRYGFNFRFDPTWSIKPGDEVKTDPGFKAVVVAVIMPRRK